MPRLKEEENGGGAVSACRAFVDRYSRFCTLSAWLVASVAAALLLHTRAMGMPAVQQATPSPTATPVDQRFGAIESFWAPQEAAELGVGWERILFYWNEIQPTGPDDWNTLHVLEEWLVEANEHDRVVLGLLKNTPAWATDGPPYSGLPRGLYLPVDDPDNLWANYVKRVVAYYSPRGVHHWIVWNEPEIAQGVYGHEFDGTVKDYIRLLQVAYIVAKEHDPEAVIHLAGYSFWHDPAYLDAFFSELVTIPEAAETDYFFDVLSLHIYFRVETVRELVLAADELQNSYGIDKPIWINETNAAPNLDPWWPVQRPLFQVDLDQQAWYLVQAYALGFAAGADSIGVYKLIDVLLPEGGESFGILRPDYSRRPAFLSYRTLIKLLAGETESVRLQEDAGYFVVTFSKHDHIVRILWARQANALQVELPAFAGRGELVDYTGASSEIVARDGLYIVSLEGARCEERCDIGGPPLFLIESGAGSTADMTATLAPPTSATVTAMPSVSPTYTPWPTDTPTPTQTPTITPSATPTPTASPTSTATPSLTPLPATRPSETRLPDSSPTSEPVAVADANTAGSATSRPAYPLETVTAAPAFLVFGLAGVVTVAVLVLSLRNRRP